MSSTSSPPSPGRPRKRSPSKTRPPRPSTPFPPETGPHRPQPRQRIFHGPPCSPGCGPQEQQPPCFGPQSPTPDSAGRWRRPCRWRKGSMRATASPPPSSAACSALGSISPPPSRRKTVTMSCSMSGPICAGGTTGPSPWPIWPCACTGSTPFCGWPTACSAGTWRPPATRR